jgi:hypothetical protein
MTDQLGLFTTIMRERAGSFLTPINWHSNGLRGHLHAGSQCAKLRRNGVQTRAILLVDALADHVVCADCISGGRFTPEQANTIRAARVLVDIERRKTWNRSGTYNGYPAIVALGTRIHLETLISSVNGLTEGHGLENWCERVIAQLDDETPAMPERFELDQQAVRWTAPRLLQRLLVAGKLPRGFWGTGGKANAVFDTSALQEYSYGIHKSPLGSFTKAWLDQVANGEDPREVTAKFLDDGAYIGLLGEPDQQQLQRCEVVLEPQADEKLWQFARRNWAHQTLEGLREAAANMGAYYDNCVAPANKMIMANHHWGVSALLLQLLSETRDTGLAGTQEALGTNERSLIICHPTIAKYIALTQGYNEWSEPIPVDEDTSNEVLETALALWEPRNPSSSYHGFGAAIAAAKVI